MLSRKEVGKVKRKLLRSLLPLVIITTSCSNPPDESVQPTRELVLKKEEPIQTSDQSNIPPKIGVDDTFPTDILLEPKLIDKKDFLENTTEVGSNGETIVTNGHNLLVLVNKHRQLPRDFVPTNLVIPDVPFKIQRYDEKKQLRDIAAKALEELFSAAKADGIELVAKSGYRSFGRQEMLYNYNVKKYGEAEANRSSAKPGQSEHQTGLAMDVTAASVALSLTQKFGETNEGKWLAEHAAEFGFIIRYPKDREHITGYIYEPWHIRYVGVEVAKKIMGQDLSLEEFLHFKPKN
jgi:zinc D-Ala-D-Ala carboxypeptidase